jgi:hypothetical protein
MTICPKQPTFSHDFLVPGATCPICQMRSDSTQSESAPITIPSSSVAPPTPAPSQVGVQSAVATSAQLTTVAPTFRRSIDAASAARRKSILTAKTPSSLSLDYVFAVRVAHAAFKPSSPISEFTTFQESWRCSITSGTTLTFSEFREQVQADGIALATHGAPNLHRILFPHGRGTFHLAANHLAPKNPSPQLITPWDWTISLTIQEIIKRGGWHRPKNAGPSYCYPITMIWYPPYYEDPDPEEEAEEVEEYAQAMFEAAEEAAVRYPGHSVGVFLPNKKGVHKRLISESTPGLEREVEGERGRARRNSPTPPAGVVSR